MCDGKHRNDTTYMHIVKCLVYFSKLAFVRDKFVYFDRAPEIV